MEKGDLNLLDHLSKMEKGEIELAGPSQFMGSLGSVQGSGFSMGAVLNHIELFLAGGGAPPYIQLKKHSVICIWLYFPVKSLLLHL